MRQVDRRRFLMLTAAGLALLPVVGRASRAALTVPEVKRLTLTIVVDNFVHAFAPQFHADDLTVARPGPGLSPDAPPRDTLKGEFGFSVLAESMRDGETRNVLVDFGYTAGTFLNNMALLGLDAGVVDAMVLSHAHYDHFGGIMGILEAAGRPRPGTSLIVGGNEAFCAREAMLPGGPFNFGMLDRAALKEKGIDLVVAPEPMLVAGHAFTTGEIPLTSFERAAMPTQFRPGVGCEAESLPEAKRHGDAVADDAQHELATAYLVKGKGLVVISSCSHRGVINTVRQAQAVSGVKKVHAVIGGFHLVYPRTEEDARQTLAALAEIDPDYIIPMHCSGEDFVLAALSAMPEKVIRPFVGSRFTFGGRG